MVNAGVVLFVLQERALVDVPQHDAAVLAARREVRASGREVQAEHCVGVAVESVLQSHRVRVPDFDCSVPRGRRENWVLSFRRKSNAADPVGVGVVLHCVLALTDGIPNFDGLVHASGGDLSVVGGERAREDVFFVVDEGDSALAAL